MHVITILTAFATILLARASMRGGATMPTGPAVVHLIMAIVLAGLFGTVVGFRLALESAITVAPEQYGLALARGASVALIPLVWALASAIVLVLWNAVASQRRSRTSQ